MGNYWLQCIQLESIWHNIKDEYIKEAACEISVNLCARNSSIANAGSLCFTIKCPTVGTYVMFIDITAYSGTYISAVKVACERCIGFIYKTRLLMAISKSKHGATLSKEPLYDYHSHRLLVSLTNGIDFSFKTPISYQDMVDFFVPCRKI